ncbi:MAG: hypothetical protein K0Q52_1893, partial [Microbacterium sp.]|nr:hypothetical protein [Microbacterium sp.]
MRRTLRASAAVIVAALALSVLPVTPASATDPIPGPIDEIVGIPSQVAKSATGSPMGDAAYSNLLRALRAAVGPGTTVAQVPKPLTTAATLTRGAAGGPLVGSFLAGVAIGSGGLRVYAMTTGADVLPGVCGSVFEGVSQWMYTDLMPDCSKVPLDPNSDQALSFPPLVYGATTVNSTGTSGIYTCLLRSGAIPAGATFRVRSPSTPAGTWGISSAPATSGTGGGYCSLPLSGSAYANLTAYAWSVGGEIVAETHQAPNNATRTPRCTVSGDGSSVTRDGDPYNELAGVPLSAARLGCAQAYEDFVSAPGRGPGFLPDRVKIESDDGTSITQIADQEVPDLAPDQKKSFVEGNGHGLVLSRVVGTLMQSCMTWEADCAGWWAASDEGTSSTSPYRCTYAGEQIALIECGAYRHTFDSQTATPTITNPDTGNQVGWTAQPNTGNSINPGTGPGTGASPADQCYAAGWAAVANPVDWILVPVKCALVWAFVPRATVTAAAQTTMQAAWVASTPGQLSEAVSAVTPAIAALNNGSCGGLILPYPEVGAGWSVQIENAPVLAACPGDFFAPWAPWFFWFISASLAIGGFFAIKSYL